MVREENKVVKEASYFLGNLIYSSVPSKRTTTQIRPAGSSGAYTSNQTIVFRFPQKDFLDCQSSYIKYKLTLSATNDNTSFLGSHALIQRLVIKDGGQILEDINNYHFLHRLITLSMAPEDLDKGKTILYGSGKEFMEAPSVTNGGNAGTVNNKTFIMTLDLSGLFSNNKYVPLEYIQGGLQVEITLSRDTDAVLAASSAKTFTVNDPVFVADVVQFDESFHQQFKSYLQQMPLELYFHTYTNYYSSLSGSLNSVVISDKSSSVKDLYFCIVADANVTGTDAYKKNSYQFAALTDPFNVSLQIGNERVPQYGMGSYAECYSELKKSFNTLGDIINGGQLNLTRYVSGIASSGSTEGECVSFVMGLNLESHIASSVEGNLVMSGRDSKSVTNNMVLLINNASSLTNNTLLAWVHKDCIYSVDSFGKGVLSY